MAFMKLTVEQQKKLIPDDAVRTIFMQRDDIRLLPEIEQEKRWQKHLIKMNEFRSFLSGCNSIVIQ